MLRPSPPPRIRQIRPRLPEHLAFKSQQCTPSMQSPFFRPRMSAGLSSTRPMQHQPVGQPLVVDLDTESSSPQQGDHAVAPLDTSIVAIPNRVLPPGISITRNPPASSADTDTISDTTHLTSLARALAKVGDTGGERYLVLHELTESQIQGLRDLGLRERSRI